MHFDRRVAVVREPLLNWVNQSCPSLPSFSFKFRSVFPRLLLVVNPLTVFRLPDDRSSRRSSKLPCLRSSFCREPFCRRMPQLASCSCDGQRASIQSRISLSGQRIFFAPTRIGCGIRPSAIIRHMFDAILEHVRQFGDCDGVDQYWVSLCFLAFSWLLMLFSLNLYPDEVTWTAKQWKIDRVLRFGIIVSRKLEDENGRKLM